MATTTRAIEAEVIEEKPLALVRSGALEDRITIARPPEVVLEEARRAAVALQDVLAKKPRKVMMNDEQYLEFEDWQTVGRFYGITAREDGDAEYVQLGQVMGFKASALALNADGHELSRATAYCLNDEEKWRTRPKYEWHMVLKDGSTAPEESSDKSDWVWEPNPKKGGNRPKRQKVFVGEEPVPLFQLASMAQTRANAKVLRNVLAWVVVLAGYRPTPAEELDVEARNEEPEPKTQATKTEPKRESEHVAKSTPPPSNLSSAHYTEVWSRAKAQAKATGATDKIIINDVLAYLKVPRLDEVGQDYPRLLKLIDGWEPGVDFASMEKG